MSPFWIVTALTWLLFAASAAVIAHARGGDGFLGFVLGFLFGPFGLLFAYFMGDQEALLAEKIEAGSHKLCPDCAEVVRTQARVCRFCGFDFAALTLKRTA